MAEIIKGYIRVFGDNIDTDQIYPGRYLEITGLEEIGSHAMEGADANFVKNLKHPAIVVAGENFGCGSSREHAVITLLNAGVKAVVASSFGRIFFRNAINLGLPAITCPDISKKLQEDAQIEIDLKKGILRDLAQGEDHSIKKMPEYVRNIIDKGGLVPLLRSEIKENQ